MKATAEIKTATKQLVDSLLEMNTSNRSLRTSTVEAYCRDIQAGRWKLTNQGIGITKDGVLADGQHRLEAIKKSNYPPVPLLIVSGLDSDVQMVVDAHSKRSSRDLIQFAFGVRVSKSAPAIAILIMRNSQKRWHGAFTNQEIMDIIVDYKSEIAIVTETPKCANYFAAPYLAAFVLGLRSNPDMLKEIVQFMNQVETGEMLHKKMPAFHLRNLIVTTKATRGGGASQKERLEKAMKALGCHLLNDEMGVLRA